MIEYKIAVVAVASYRSVSRNPVRFKALSPTYVLENTYNAKRGGSSACLGVKTFVPWLTFLIRQLHRGRVITVETRSEGDDET